MAENISSEGISDFKKIQKQWHKLSGLHSRSEWSAAIVRAATAAEIAANFAVRSEFAARSQFDSKFVDSLLVWANGLSGKLDKLLLPLSTENPEKHRKMKSLAATARKINFKRNAIVHQGEFCNDEEAKSAIEQARLFITGLVQIYSPGFTLANTRGAHVQH